MSRVAWNKGRTLTPEHRANISAAVLSRPKGPMSEAHRAAISRARSIQWTPEMIAAVRACQSAGIGFMRMADRIGVSAGTIWAASKRGVFL